MAEFHLQAPWPPTADQPRAIAQLLQGLNDGKRYQTLLGATGTGKTMTIVSAIAQYHFRTTDCRKVKEYFVLS
jgi:excinuclease ABC subunit B